MTKRKMQRIAENHKRFLVQRLACFDTPKEASEALKEEFGVTLAPQNCEAYDPNKKAGHRLAQRFRVLFEETRKKFLADIETHVPEANKAVRIRQLAHASRAFKGKGNYIGMADMLERIAKEMGNVHTNRREISGRDGKPVEMQFGDMTLEQVDRALVQQLTALGLTVADLAPGDPDEQDEQTTHH